MGRYVDLLTGCDEIESNKPAEEIVAYETRNLKTQETLRLTFPWGALPSVCPGLVERHEREPRCSAPKQSGAPRWSTAVVRLFPITIHEILPQRTLV